MAQEEDNETGQEPSVVDLTILQQKVRASKRILIFLCVGFLVVGFCADGDLRKLFMVLSMASAYHLAFHIWCDCANPTLLLSRHKFHVYLVMLTNVLLMMLAVPFKTIFTRALAVLVMPVAFTREVGDMRPAALFLAMHAALTTYLFRQDLVDAGVFGEGVQWLSCLAIVDLMVLDVSAMRLQAAELGSLLHVAYKSSEQVSRVTVKHLLSSLCDTFVVINAESQLIEDSATLADLLGRSHHNNGTDFADCVHYDDREEFRNHVAEWHGQERDLSAKMGAITTTSLKIRLLDANSLAVPSLLFFAKLWGIDGEFVYYVGTCDAWEVKSTSKSKRSSKRHSRAMRDGNAGWQSGFQSGLLEQQLTSVLPKDGPDCWHRGLQGSLLDPNGRESSSAAFPSVSPSTWVGGVPVHTSSPTSSTAEHLAYRKLARPRSPESM